MEEVKEVKVKIFKAKINSRTPINNLDEQIMKFVDEGGFEIIDIKPLTSITPSAVDPESTMMFVLLLYKEKKGG